MPVRALASMLGVDAFAQRLNLNKAVWVAPTLAAKQPYSRLLPVCTQRRFQTPTMIDVGGKGRCLTHLVISHKLSESKSESH